MAAQATSLEIFGAYLDVADTLLLLVGHRHLRLKAFTLQTRPARRDVMFFGLAFEASPTSSHNTPPTPCKVLPYQRVDATLDLGIDSGQRFVML